MQVKQVVQQTFADRPTQMTTVGVYVSNVEDRLMTPRRYLTADKFHSNVLYIYEIIYNFTLCDVDASRS